MAKRMQKKAVKNSNPAHVISGQIKLGTREEARDGINRTALREIKLLQELHHKNIIDLLDVFGYKSEVSLVFEFMETDLEVVIRDASIAITPAHIKSYILMTLEGLEYLHLNWILHRASSHTFRSPPLRNRHIPNLTSLSGLRRT